MAGFATPEWLEQLAGGLRAVTVDPEAAFVLEQRVTGTPGASWHVEVADGRATVGEGPHPHPTVVLTLDGTTAEDIHHGRRSAQRAFLDGELRIGGDVAALLAARDLLASVLTARPAPDGPAAT